MLRIGVEEETDGRFIAEVTDLPGVMPTDKAATKPS
jgi:predicted RNase H-like HicB family nuclease